MQIEKITRQGYSATLSKEVLWDIYKSMKTQRLLEDRLLKMYKGGQLSGAVYPGIGQEACIAGIAAGMDSKDIFGCTHRDIGVQIKKGVTLKEIALNFYGKGKDLFGNMNRVTTTSAYGVELIEVVNEYKAKEAN